MNDLYAKNVGNGALYGDKLRQQNTIREYFFFVLYLVSLLRVF